LPAGLDERLAAVTAAGGLSDLPGSFGDRDADWVTVRSDNPFEVLYLQYRSAAQITPEMLGRHRDLLQQFWAGKLRSMSQGAGRLAIVEKYGGEHRSELLVQSYPDLVDRAYRRLSAPGGIQEAHRQIVGRLQTAALAQIDQRLSYFLVDTVLQPEESRDLLDLGEREGIPRSIVANRILDRLRADGFEPERLLVGTTPEVQLLATAWRPLAAAAPPPPLAAAPPSPPLAAVPGSTPLAAPAGASSRLRKLGLLAATILLTLFTAALVKRFGTSPPVVEVKPTPTATPDAVPGRQKAEVLAQLAAIRQRAPSDRVAAIEQLERLKAELWDHRQDFATELLFIDSLIDTLRAELRDAQRAIEQQAREERERQAWEQRLAKIESALRAGRYEDARQQATKELERPAIPEPVAERLRALKEAALQPPPETAPPPTIQRLAFCGMMLEVVAVYTSNSYLRDSTAILAKRHYDSMSSSGARDRGGQATGEAVDRALEDLKRTVDVGETERPFGECLTWFGNSPDPGQAYLTARSALNQWAGQGYPRPAFSPPVP
jgi:hypothetical protein